MRDSRVAVAAKRTNATGRPFGPQERVLAALARCADRLAALRGWRRRGIAALLGALAALALPPLHLLPLLPAAFTGLVWLVAGARGARQSFAVGWWFGLGHFAAGIYWIANALLTDAAKFGWMIPPIVGGLAAVLAVFPGLAVTVAWRGRGVTQIVIFALAWTAFEWLRGWILSGFPWNLIGYGWAFSDAMNQLAALTGIWGLSFVTVLAAAMPAALLARRPMAPAWRSAGILGLGLAALALLLVFCGGAWRLAGAGSEVVPGVRLRLVQATIDQAEKGESDLRLAHLARHLRLTVDTPGFEQTTHVIWPETATQFLIERDAEIRGVLASAVPPGGLLITGAPRGAPASGPLSQIWNSLIAIDVAGRIVGSFDKFHLVPLGEYVPLRRYLPSFVSKVTPGSMDFSAGPGPRTLRLPGLPPVGPLICYEVIFPGDVADGEDPPEWLLNLTNDGWFGISTGPYQHFVSARLRAVEEGVPLVRAANTGVSGVIDAYGRVTARLDLGVSGILDAELPRPTGGRTPYARYGDRIPAVLLLAAAALLVVVSLLSQRVRQSLGDIWLTTRRRATK